MSNSVQINSGYSAFKGISVQINAKQLQLTVADVCYLLLNIDGHATAPPAPPETVGFMLYGVHYQFTNEEWAHFIDALGSAAGAGGWSHTVCKYA